MKNLFTSPSLRIYWTSAFWLILFTLLFLTLTPKPVSPIAMKHIDKVFHLLAFCGFSFVFRIAYQRLALTTLFIWSALLGIVIEFVQILIPNRGFSIGDMLADLLGVIIGLIIAHQIIKK